ncbi:hypothetical protein DAEQUDRAFT_419709 [Daedalea quercina L-15889]|uniref:Uncharacterized protein n=1 Tax=Daedalea quercina L-15889 TaxID=1314783 RepID=A0A165TKN2_9APHY|nr:hypothetical protein DAEQUDRAFT_419709 [Daedalea quercina L-15889]
MRQHVGHESIATHEYHMSNCRTAYLLTLPTPILRPQRPRHPSEPCSASVEVSFHLSTQRSLIKYCTSIWTFLPWHETLPGDQPGVPRHACRPTSISVTPRSAVSAVDSDDWRTCDGSLQCTIRFRVPVISGGPGFQCLVYVAMLLLSTVPPCLREKIIMIASLEKVFVCITSFYDL